MSSAEASRNTNDDSDSDGDRGRRQAPGLPTNSNVILQAGKQGNLNANGNERINPDYQEKDKHLKRRKSDIDRSTYRANSQHPANRVPQQPIDHSLQQHLLDYDLQYQAFMSFQNPPYQQNQPLVNDNGQHQLRGTTAIMDATVTADTHETVGTINQQLIATTNTQIVLTANFQTTTRIDQGGRDDQQGNRREG